MDTTNKILPNNIKSIDEFLHYEQRYLNFVNGEHSTLHQRTYIDTYSGYLADSLTSGYWHQELNRISDFTEEEVDFYINSSFWENDTARLVFQGLCNNEKAMTKIIGLTNNAIFMIGDKLKENIEFMFTLLSDEKYSKESLYAKINLYKDSFSVALDKQEFVLKLLNNNQDLKYAFEGHLGTYEQERAINQVCSKRIAFSVSKTSPIKWLEWNRDIANGGKKKYDK